jgi:hypothetical protein
MLERVPFHTTLLKPDLIVPASGEEIATADWATNFEGQEIDFFLNFGEPTLASHFSALARFGSWSFVYGAFPKFLSPLPCFWEIYHGEAVVGAALICRRHRGGSMSLLKSGYLTSIPHSLTENVDALLQAITDWPTLVCRELQASVPKGRDLEASPLNLGIPSRSQVVRFRLIEAKNRLARLIQNQYFRIDWNVGILKESPCAFIGREASAHVSVITKCRRGRYLADPCVVREGSQTFVFCEEYHYDTNRGVIAALTVSDHASEPVPIIQESFHLSYPQVFRYGATYYCIPESGAAKRVYLYKATNFPLSWSLDRTLIENFAAVDSTILKYDGRWWLFCTNGSDGYKGFNSHLYVWHARELFGPWTPHVKNPVKIDVRSSRPAGGFFRHNGYWYRPAQDCSQTYGWRIRINRIESLSETDFEETVVGSINPPAGKYNRGIHTLSSSNGYHVVDVKRYIFEPAAVVHHILGSARTVAKALGVSDSTIQAIKERITGS